MRIWIPTADVVINLTPDKNHSPVVEAAVVPLMKKGATLSYSHGFNIVEEGMTIREGSDRNYGGTQSVQALRLERNIRRGFGVPTLIAVHPENDPQGAWIGLKRKPMPLLREGIERACLESSFVAEVKSDLMGEQTILCGDVTDRVYLEF